MTHTHKQTHTYTHAHTHAQSVLTHEYEGDALDDCNLPTIKESEGGVKREHVPGDERCDSVGTQRQSAGEPKNECKPLSQWQLNHPQHGCCKQSKEMCPEANGVQEGCSKELCQRQTELEPHWVRRHPVHEPLRLGLQRKDQRVECISVSGGGWLAAAAAQPPLQHLHACIQAHCVCHKHKAPHQHCPYACVAPSIRPRAQLVPQHITNHQHCSAVLHE